MKVQCPICKRKNFETTERYDPDVTPNGSFVKCLLSYPIDWLTMSTTLCSEMTCPECQAQLAPSGRLHVIPDPIKVIVNELNVPVRDDSPQLVVEDDVVMVVDPKEFKRKKRR